MSMNGGVFVCINTYIHTYNPTHTHACMHTRIHAYIITQRSTGSSSILMKICISMMKLIYVSVCVYIHTHTCTHIYINIALRVNACMLQVKTGIYRPQINITDDSYLPEDMREPPTYDYDEDDEIRKYLQKRGDDEESSER